MEVSAPVKILEGDSKVIGVTVGTVPGSGECAAITSFSAVNLYSMVTKNVIATWTFPSNSQERVSSPAYIVNDKGDLIACQGPTTILQWKNSTPSVKSFDSSKVKDSTLLLIPIGSYLLRVSTNNICYVLSDKLVELDHINLPSANKIIKFDIKRPSSDTCTICFLLQKEDSYSVAILQCSYSESPVLSILEAPVPSQSAVPIDMTYISSWNVVYLFYSDSSLWQYYFQCNAETGDSRLLLQHSVPRLFANTEQDIQCPVCLTVLEERCIAYASTADSKSYLHFFHSEFMSEITSLELPSSPSGIVYHNSQLFIMINGELYLSSVSLSPLSLKDMVRHGSNEVPHLSKRLRVNSHVLSIGKLLKDIPMGFQAEEELEKLKDVKSFEEEEESILKEPRKTFESKALEFIRSRVLHNHHVISFSKQFLREFVQRCILKKHRVLSSVLQGLLKCRVDISVNENILQAILDAKDIATLLLYLQYVSPISERDLLNILVCCLFFSPKTILKYATEQEWDTSDESEIRKRFIHMISIRILQIPCNYSRLQQEMSRISLDIVYSIALSLTSLELYITRSSMDEIAAWRKYTVKGRIGFVSNLISWLCCLLDANIVRILIDMRTDSRFKELFTMLKKIVKDDTEFYKGMISLNGILNHIERQIPLPARATPIYSIEEILF